MNKAQTLLVVGFVLGVGMTAIGLYLTPAWKRKAEQRTPATSPQRTLSPLLERVQCCLEETELYDAQRCEYRYTVQFTPEEMGRMLALRHRYHAKESEV